MSNLYNCLDLESVLQDKEKHMKVRLTKAWVGVDVSKEWLDIYVHPTKKTLRVGNDGRGIKRLLDLCKRYDVQRVACESSGGYEHMLVKKLNHKKLPVWRIDPKRIKGFVIAQGVKAKTDIIDAKMIALFSVNHQPAYTTIHKQKQEEKLSMLIKRRDDLIAFQTQEKQRLSNPVTEYKPSIKRLLKLLAQEIKTIEEKIQSIIENDKNLLRKQKIMQSMFGIGEITARTLIISMPELGKINKKQAAALLGVAPYTHQSGKINKQAKIRGGRSMPRKAVYMAALSVIRSGNSPLAEFYQRLIKKGKKAKVALVAVMRKIIVILNVMLHKDQLWELVPVPSRESRVKPAPAAVEPS